MKSISPVVTTPRLVEAVGFGGWMLVIGDNEGVFARRSISNDANVAEEDNV